MSEDEELYDPDDEEEELDEEEEDDGEEEEENLAALRQWQDDLKWELERAATERAAFLCGFDREMEENEDDC